MAVKDFKKELEMEQESSYKIYGHLILHSAYVFSLLLLVALIFYAMYYVYTLVGWF